MQERIFNEVYDKKKVCLGPMHSINAELMDKEPEYFGEAKEICEEFGLHSLMQFNHDIHKDIISQFYAMVHLNKTNEREFIWMTKDKLMKATWAPFGDCLGYLVVDDPTSAGLFHVHIIEHPTAKKHLAHLYIPGWDVPGDTKNLLRVYDIMQWIYREVLNPKVGNHDQLHGFMVILMLLTHSNRGSSLKPDVMDFIWNEIQWGLCHKKRPPYAPYLVHLICVHWTQEFGSDLLSLLGIDTVCHPVKGPRIKQHEKPRDAAAGGDAGTETREAMRMSQRHQTSSLSRRRVGGARLSPNSSKSFAFRILRRRSCTIIM
jgi:hypothetical protein